MWKDIEQTRAVVSITFTKPETDTFVVYARIRQVGTTEWESILIPPNFLSSIEQTIDNLMQLRNTCCRHPRALTSGWSEQVHTLWHPAADVASLYFVHPSQTQFTFTAFLTSSEVVQLPVYFRYRVLGSRQWLYAQNDSYEANDGTELAVGWLHGLTAGREYELEASTDPDFPIERTETATFTTRPPSVLRVQADSVTQTRATITAVVGAPNGDRQTVYARYREMGEPDWTDLQTGRPPQTRPHGGWTT